MTMQVCHGLLSFTVHTKPKVRLWGPGVGGGGRPHSSKPAGAGFLSGPGRSPCVLDSHPEFLLLPEALSAHSCRRDGHSQACLNFCCLTGQ